MASPKPKARSAPRKVPDAEKDPRPQKERFIDAARELGVTDETFEKAVRKIAPPKRK
jgi:hypothetical protein